MKKECLLYQKLDNQGVECQNCAHYCRIKPGEKGICGIRKNINGKLYLLTYGRAVAENVDPIEKKPFFHFLPGSFTLSVATVGCNFRCANCQNWQISQFPNFTTSDLETEKSGFDLPPEKIVQDALDNNCQSIAYTYTEPTVFSEYALATMKLAQPAGLKNVWVSNGFQSKELIKEIIPYLDAINIDLKAFSEKSYRQYFGGQLEPVLENLKKFKEAGIWLEITTLVIPTITDSLKMFQEMAMWIKNNLGVETPWHLSRFSGEISWKLKDLPDTPIEKVEQAIRIAKKAGLKYVYPGNI
ncbi:MAG TPA: AmmeMemoRadiSam system radical SAM enzyme [Candidatus Portnoybacteria bacterium]|nr:AmmeMemoRadiSam system radical SAM enzyme [Candidatus Portnoybacteria bacterium]